MFQRTQAKGNEPNRAFTVLPETQMLSMLGLSSKNLEWTIFCNTPVPHSYDDPMNRLNLTSSPDLCFERNVLRKY